MENDKPKKVLILGGGASGQRAAVDLIEAGAEVILVEAEDTIGGTMLKLGTMFPKHNCLLCRGDEVHGNGCTRPGISQTLLDYSAPAGLDIRTRSRVVKVEEGINDTYEVTVVTKPRYVLPEKCILCGRCSEICPHSLPDPYQAELVERKAVYLPAERCVPESYAVEKGDYCTGCGKCQEICPTDAIDLSQETAAETVTADAVVLASGMQLYDPRLSAEYGYGSYSNVISGMQMERMVSPAGPGEGNPARGSDGKAPEKIAWLQCVGSRDEDHDFCSSYCCGYATRQAVLAKQLLPDADMRIFMMDDRVFGRNFSRTYDLLRKEYNIALEHCRISVLRQDDETKDLILQINGEDGTVREESFSMVVLSIGGTGSIAREEMKELFGIESDEHGFVRTDTFAPLDTSRPGIFAAGSVSGPSDLADSVTGGSAAAARACSYLGIEARRHREDGPRVSASGAGGKHGSGSPKIGIFVCNCGGEIGNTVNLDTLSGEISGKYVDGFEVIPYGCLPEGTGAIRSAIAANNLTHAVIGACKRRTYGPLFRRELPVPVEFVSLREECAYVHGSDPEGATRKALTLLRDKLGPIQAEPESAVVDIVQIYSPGAVLVIGGGLAGLTASLHLADAGAEVHLVEREEVLGGNALRLNRSPEGVAVPQLMEKTVEEVVNNPRISVYTRSEVKRQVSSRGVITASIRPAEGIESGGETAVTAGAVIITSGGEEYRGPVFGLDSFEKVMTLLDLAERQRSNPGLASSVKEVVFIGCAGPWCEPGSTQSWRCSRTCCETMVKQARYFREQNPACRVTVLVREVNTYSVKEEDYTAARKAGVLFVRYTPDDLPVYSENGEGPCLLVHDKHLGETLEFHPDMVVLAAAILPREDALRLSGSLEVPLDEDGFFKEWESKTRPYSTLEPVVSVAGLAHGPKPVREVITQSLAAAQNALANLNTKRLIDTRDVAKVSFGDCTSCLTCVRSCPYSVPKIGKEGYPRNGKKGRAFIDVFRCQGCGACVSECPAKAISLERFSDKVMLESGVLGGTSVTVISCRYCGNIPIELAGTGRHQYPADVKVVDVPCTGFITSRHILSALEQGAEGVLVHACPEGACHHLTGNKRAEKRLAYCRELLKAAGMNPDRVRFADLGIGHGEAFARLVTEFSRELRKAGEPREVHG